MNTLNARAFRSSLLGALVMAVFVGASALITIYLAMKDPALLARRMNVGADSGSAEGGDWSSCSSSRPSSS
jgi:hypothetical protein